MRKKDGYNKKFTTKTVDITKGSTFYLFSDGYMDQFGGSEKEKFNLPKFTELLIDCAAKNPQEQKQIMTNTFDRWMGQEHQLDDVLILGIKF